MKPTELIVALHDTDAFDNDAGILAATEDADWPDKSLRDEDGALDMSKLPGCRMLALSFSADKATTVMVTKRRGSSTVESYILNGASVGVHKGQGPLEIPVCGLDFVDFTVQTDDTSFDFFQLEAVFSGVR